jgi:hypothetical protein
MAKEPTTVFIKGKALRCPVCDGDRFKTRRTLIPNHPLAFLSWEWLGKSAQHHACVRCGYLYWFVKVD